MEHTVDWLAQSGGVAPALLRSHAYTLQPAATRRFSAAGLRESYFACMSVCASVQANSKIA